MEVTKGGAEQSALIILYEEFLATIIAIIFWRGCNQLQQQKNEFGASKNLL
jgi:hypothetical protein